MHPTEGTRDTQPKDDNYIEKVGFAANSRGNNNQSRKISSQTLKDNYSNKTRRGERPEQKNYFRSSTSCIDVIILCFGF
jgi:hypothetical protein